MAKMVVRGTLQPRFQLTKVFRVAIFVEPQTLTGITTSKDMKEGMVEIVHTAANPIKGRIVVNKRNCNHDKERKMENHHIGKSNGRWKQWCYIIGYFYHRVLDQIIKSGC
jgi:hypothetical protein